MYSTIDTISKSISIMLNCFTNKKQISIYTYTSDENILIINSACDTYINIKKVFRCKNRLTMKLVYYLLLLLENI